MICFVRFEICAIICRISGTVAFFSLLLRWTQTLYCAMARHRVTEFNAKKWNRGSFANLRSWQFIRCSEYSDGLTKSDLWLRKSAALKEINERNAPAIYFSSLYSLMAVVLIAGHFTKSFDGSRARCLWTASSCCGADATAPLWCKSPFTSSLARSSPLFPSLCQLRSGEYAKHFRLLVEVQGFCDR